MINSLKVIIENMSLWRTTTGFGHVPAKSIHYQSNGFGRDRYISVNSGGLMQPQETVTAFSIGTSIAYFRHIS